MIATRQCPATVSLLLWFAFTAGATAWGEPTTFLRNAGDPRVRLDVVILGDGYTAAEQGRFAADAARVADTLLAEPPFDTYASYLNVRRVDVVSAQSGADFPSRGILVDTALGSRFECGGITRLVCVDFSLVNAALSRSVDATSRDIVIVLVNDPEYGGSGGAFAVTSRHPAALDIVIHELGHSFGLLADEYGGPPPPACDLSFEPAAVNVTRQTDRSLIKWRHWIDAATAVPTTSFVQGIPGLYQGADYCDAGKYRPTFMSKMRANGRPFEQINTEQLIKRLYNFVPLLETVVPQQGPLVAAPGQHLLFEVQTPPPPPHGLELQWRVDGAPVGGSGTLFLDTALLAPGAHTVQVTARDPSPLVRHDPGSALTATATWQVTVSVTDLDTDGLPDSWESLTGLTGGDASPTADPDGDGRTNLQEFQDGTHPRGTVKRFFAEGATGAFFTTRIALFNPGATREAVHVRFQKPDGTQVAVMLDVPALARRTLDVGSIAGLDDTAFSTVVDAAAPIVADRTMSWDRRGYGSHAEAGVVAGSKTWFFAEGATHSGFQLFYLLQNPATVDAHVQVEFLRPSPLPPVVKSYVVPAGTRQNIWVNTEPDLASTDLSATITSDVAVIVERAMYRDGPGQLFSAGHESAGVTAPETSWYFAEGATGPYFDLFILLANPSSTPTTCDVRFLLPDGTVLTRPTPLGPRSRENVWVDAEGGPLADTAVSTTVSCTSPVVAERAMWWPGPTAVTWHEAHNTFGAIATGTRWASAEGEVGGPQRVETYLLLANTSNLAGMAAVTIYPESGTPQSRTYALAANSRTNVAIATDFGVSGHVRFGAIVESTGATPAQIVVERAMYSDAGGVRWAAGSNAQAARLP